ncbi:hypothetical protein EVAR_55901_1 [Eumeta japonica]|uniref:Uncharacterized protein n=1 Tax=Eumeta variegata TaxID=151549 RepID=A0A4C1YLW0_EUMVA|nr:hypothetical protein EVAR_55901_1 [Eumeta japonica]
MISSGESARRQSAQRDAVTSRSRPQEQKARASRAIGQIGAGRPRATRIGRRHRAPAMHPRLVGRDSKHRYDSLSRLKIERISHYRTFANPISPAVVTWIRPWNE